MTEVAAVVIVDGLLIKVDGSPTAVVVDGVDVARELCCMDAMVGSFADIDPALIVAPVIEATETAAPLHEVEAEPEAAAVSSLAADADALREVLKAMPALPPAVPVEDLDLRTTAAGADVTTGELIDVDVDADVGRGVVIAAAPEPTSIMPAPSLAAIESFIIPSQFTASIPVPSPLPKVFVEFTFGFTIAAPAPRIRMRFDSKLQASNCCML